VVPQGGRSGDADAQFNLGRIYGKATGTYAKARAATQDDVEAVKWYRRSAEQGYRPAQFNLAEIYAEGSRDVPRDDVLAYFWMSLAASGGEPAAVQKLERYAAQITTTQLIMSSLRSASACLKYLSGVKRSPGWVAA